MAMQEDFDAFFNTEEFADTASFKNSALPVPVEIGTANGLFDSLYVNSFGEVENYNPCFLMPVSAVPLVGMHVQIKDIHYTIAAKKFDKNGLMVLILENR